MPATKTAPFGWTVVANDGRKNGLPFFAYKRSCPADVRHFADDLATFTFRTRKEAYASGRAGHYAYKR